MTRTALQRYVAEQVQHAVVRIREELVDPEGVATGFFIDPTGYLITAFHSVKHRYFSGSSVLPMTIEFDVSDPNGFPATPARHTVDAYTTLEWTDPKADWALLKLDFRPVCYLPLTKSNADRRSGDLSDAELRVYGFNVTDQSRAKVTVFKGDYAGYLTEKKRHLVSYIVRTEGQSGGPVIDMGTGSVIGSVVGYRSREVLTGEAADLDQSLLGSLGLDLDFGAVARKWNVGAAQSICSNDDMLSSMLENAISPSLPVTMLAGREIVKKVVSEAEENDSSGVFLYGSGGSGKTTIATEAAGILKSRRDASSIFYHDFAAEVNRNTSSLLQRLSLNLLMHHSRYSPIMACLDAGTVVHKPEVVQTVLEAAREQAVVFIFDNIHFLSPVEHSEMLNLLRGVESAIKVGKNSQIIFASRHTPPAGIRATVVPCSGFTDTEVAGFLELHDVGLESRELSNVCRFGSSIVCIEEIARSPQWRQKVALGFDTSDGTESLQNYWTDNYADLPEAEHNVLLAAAVIGRPATRDELEEIAGAQNFARTLENLQRDPPLVRYTDGYSLHADVESAVLFVSDREKISSIRSKAAKHFVSTRRFIEGARHYILLAETDEALNVLYLYREEIITTGLVGELEKLAVSITEDLSLDSIKRQRSSYHVNVITASCHTARGEYEEALSRWSHSIRTAPDDSARAALLRRLGDASRMASDYTSAAGHYRDATKLLEGSQAHADLTEFAAASIGLGKLDRLWANYPAAHRRYADARASYVALFERSGLAEAEFGIGEVKRLQSKWNESETAYANSREHADSVGNLERRAYALWGLGEVCRLTGRTEEAIDYHRSGLDICVRLGDRRSEGWALLGIGQVEDSLRRNEVARAAYEEALRLFRQTRSSTEISHTLLSLAESYRAVGEIRESLYEESELLYKKLNLRHCLIQHGIVKACALRSMGQRRRGDSTLKAAHKLAKRCGIESEMRLIESILKVSDATVLPPLNFP
ncbi:tetratricopeptide repeat protein [Streptomyces sp. NPDC058155]|uniref:tetratricopeptide repeat protein n=1 Tax=Streptomyces sp. NPDC058155 TaxID=3346359 RepID=UPI0036E95A42